MVSFRALRQTKLVIRFWIASFVWFKRKKLCFVARLCRIFKTKIVMSQSTFDNNQIYLDLIHIKSLLAISRMERDFVSSKVDSK